jgi:hypothetical protein
MQRANKWMRSGRIEAAMVGLGGTFVVSAALWTAVFGIH